MLLYEIELPAVLLPWVPEGFFSLASGGSARKPSRVGRFWHPGYSVAGLSEEKVLKVTYNKLKYRVNRVLLSKALSCERLPEEI